MAVTVTAPVRSTEKKSQPNPPVTTRKEPRDVGEETANTIKYSPVKKVERNRVTRVESAVRNRWKFGPSCVVSSYPARAQCRAGLASSVAGVDQLFCVNAPESTPALEIYIHQRAPVGIFSRGETSSILPVWGIARLLAMVGSDNKRRRYSAVLEKR